MPQQKRINWGPPVALFLSLPSLAALSVDPYGAIFGCDGGFIDTVASCAANGLVGVFYSVLTLSSMVGLLLGIVLVPLTLGIAIRALFKLPKETQRDLTWYTAWICVIATLLIQGSAVFTFGPQIVRGFS